MAVYEINANRTSLVHPMQPAKSTFDADAGTLVTDHLAGLLGERVLPVARGTDREDEPYLTALDTSGSLLIVELVQELDADGLVSALRRAGRAGRRTRAEIAQSYTGGASRFEADYATFRSATPMSDVGSRGGSGPRLVLMCSSVDLTTLDALDFLRRLGPQVQILRVGVIRTNDGRRFVEISPLGDGGRGPRAVETTQEIPAVRSAASATSGAHQVVRYDPQADASTGWGTNVWPQSGSPAAESGLPQRVASAISPAEAVSARVAAEPVPSRSAGAGTAGAGAGDAGADNGAGADDRAGDGAVAVGGWTAGVGDSSATALPELRLPPEVPGSVEGLRDAAQGTRARRRVEETAIDTNPNGLPSAAAAESARMFARAMAYGQTQAATPSGGGHAAHASSGEVRGPSDPRLARFAATLDGPVDLVWTRLRRGERFVARLHPEGVLELADGSRYADPGAAATAISGAPTAVDGWRVWRIGDDGPALSDAI